MKKLLLQITFLIISNSIFSQILMNDVSDLWTPDLIIKNKISQIIFLPSRGDTIITKYRLDGQPKIEYLIDKEDKDKSTVFYIYENNLLIEELHFNLSRNDTITFTTYEYENARLEKVISINQTLKNKEVDNYFYDEKGNLLIIVSKLETDKVIRNTIKEYDKSGRLVQEIENRNQKDYITQYSYQEDKVVIESEKGNTIIHFNKKGFPISVSTKEENRISFQLIYDERGLLQRIENNGKIEAEVKYVNR